MSPQSIHAALIISTIGISMVFGLSSFGIYDAQISAVLIIMYFIGRKFFPPSTARLIESLVYTFIITSIVVTTGDLSSPFFFLLYFLLFALSLFLEPPISIATTASYIVYFLLFFPPLDNVKKIIPLISLALLTPFAIMLAREYINDQRQKMKLTAMQKDTGLFLTLVLKNHIQAIIQAAENFMGDHHLAEIEKNARRMEDLIDEYEKTI